jgi:hypothetical protein
MADQPAPNADDNEELTPLTRAAYDAFAAELEEMLKTHGGKWVIYYGSQRLAFGDSPTDLLEEYYHQRGYPVNDLTVLEVDRNQPLAHVDW